MLNGLTRLHFVSQISDLESNLETKQLKENRKPIVFELVTQIYKVNGIDKLLKDWKVGSDEMLLDINCQHPIVDV